MRPTLLLRFGRRAELVDEPLLYEWMGPGQRGGYSGTHLSILSGRRYLRNPFASLASVPIRLHECPMHRIVQVRVLKSRPCPRRALKRSSSFCSTSTESSPTVRSGFFPLRRGSNKP